MQIHTLTSITLLLISITAQSQVTDSVYMGSGYENDVYYSMENGMLSMEDAQEWDMAFRTDAFSSAIFINDGNGAVLKTYPNGDTADWATLDTAGFSQWPGMYNHESDWDMSAFERHTLGHPDYGWGTYSMTTHNVTGDSIFVLKLTDGSFKKVWIEQKESTQNTYYFRHADLDGENEVDVELDVDPYTEKHHIFYSIADDEVVDREPKKSEWDIVFSRYVSMIDGETPYIVTGVISNLNTPVAEYVPVSPDFTDWQPADFDTSKSVIGYDWKEFDMGSYTYTVDDSLVYFIESQENNIYKLRFTAFEGSSTGKVVFEKEQVSTTDIDELAGSEQGMLRVYPNPAHTYLNVEFAGTDEAEVELYDVSGQLVKTGQLSGGDYRTDVSGLQRGVYIVRVKAGHNLISKKFSVR
ncbi:MAG: T9SS type A sorting domain-containing protein [Bacteroidota bacterium]